jgi:hypothetical protein
MDKMCKNPEEVKKLSQKEIRTRLGEILDYDMSNHFKDQISSYIFKKISSPYGDSSKEVLLYLIRTIFSS